MNANPLMSRKKCFLVCVVTRIVGLPYVRYKQAKTIEFIFFVLLAYFE